VVGVDQVLVLAGECGSLDGGYRGARPHDKVPSWEAKATRFRPVPEASGFA